MRLSPLATTVIMFILLLPFFIMEGKDYAVNGWMFGGGELWKYA
jgi:hypothetical protein